MKQNADSRVLRFVLAGAFLALALETVATLLLLALQHSGREVAAANIAADIVAASLGFGFAARRVERSQALMIAVIFFPTILGLMFLEAVYLDARLYGNTF